MQPALPITVKRSLLLPIFWVVLWVLLFGVVFWGIDNSPLDPSLRSILWQLVAILFIFTGAALVVSIVLYFAATFTIAQDGLKVLRYKTLFDSVQDSISWHDVQEVTVTEGGILKSLFGVGTLLVQTSAAQPNLVLNYLPNVDALYATVDALQKAAETTANPNG